MYDELESGCLRLEKGLARVSGSRVTKKPINAQIGNQLRSYPPTPRPRSVVVYARCQGQSSRHRNHPTPLFELFLETAESFYLFVRTATANHRGIRNV
jgi:hypothetical protein